MVVLTNFKLGDLSLTNLFDSRDLQFVLCCGSASELLEAHWIIFALKEARSFITAVLDPESLKGLLLSLVEHDEVIRDYAHLLECNCLHLCHGETLDNPAFLTLL